MFDSSININFRNLAIPQKQNQTGVQKNQLEKTAENSSVLTNYLSFTGNVNKMNIGFKGDESLKTADPKIVNYVKTILTDEIKLKENQPLIIQADKKYRRFVELMEQEAYKMGSDRVIIEYKEPELEKLHETYYPNHQPVWKKLKEEELQKAGATKYNFDEAEPFKASKLTQREIKSVQKANKADIPQSIAEKLELNPADLIDTCLNLRKGQPVAIFAEREHEPNVLKKAKYAYKKGSGPVEIIYNEPGADINLLKYGSDNALNSLTTFNIKKAKLQEIFDTNAARVILYSPNPNALEGIDADRIQKAKPPEKETTELAGLMNDITLFNPRIIYHAPTIAGVKKAYSEFSDPLKALDKAADEAKEITRPGTFKAHLEKLAAVAKKLNELNIDKLHLTSSDGTTDLWVGLSQKSKFICTEKLTPSGQLFAANCPSEEVFTTPDKTRTSGKVAATRPFVVNGNIIEGAQFEFKNGKLIPEKTKAKKGEEFLRKHIENNTNADMLGEISLVADSPIFKKNRIFFNTLVDENSACHMALGDGYPVCIDGALSIKDPTERKKLLADNNCNFSSTHDDIMIGSPDVKVEALTKDGGTITLLENNKFQI
jgi:aminopeptidase